MNDNTPCHFLLLPAELRLQIYNYVIPEVPLRQPRTQYSGLVFSCRQTRAELEPTILKVMRDVLAGIAEACTEIWHHDITFKTFHTLSELENLTVLGGFDWRRRRPLGEYPHRRSDHPLVKLLEMHFHALTIKAACKHDDTELEAHGIYSTWITEPFIASPTDDAKRRPAVKSFEYDCSAIFTCTRALPRDLRLGLKKSIIREHVWELCTRKNEDGHSIAFRFERLPSSPASAAPPEGYIDTNNVTCE
jgi:hypothetical protein